MLSEESFVLQTLNSGLYFLRTIRDFAINIQLSFLENNSEYISTAKDFGDRAEELIGDLMVYANENVTKEALNNQIFVTAYTLDTELLTEKLFFIDIDTTITEEQSKLAAGFTQNPSQTIIDELMRVNKSALTLVTNFISFCENIIARMSNNDLFSYSYISLIEAMMTEANLYKLNLERLSAGNNIDPSFKADYEYLFNNLLQRYASFVRGFVDPKNAEVILRAGAFSSEFGLIASEYKNAIVNPNVAEELKVRSIDTIDRFRDFLSEVIEDLLDSKTYFIVEPILLDNILTTANYFKYTLLATSY
ncbi:MAG: DUF2935 domain-containing protein [Bacilli bacterium]|nr:DUF2935 domain-containing protein [Bacilli bacterium]